MQRLKRAYSFCNAKILRLLQSKSVRDHIIVYRTFTFSRNFYHSFVSIQRLGQLFSYYSPRFVLKQMRLARRNTLGKYDLYFLHIEKLSEQWILNQQIAKIGKLLNCFVALSDCYFVFSMMNYILSFFEKSTILPEEKVAVSNIWGTITWIPREQRQYALLE